jgi:hypothetical protein
MAKGLDIELQPLDADHVRALLTWREQDIGGGEISVAVTVRNPRSRKSESQLKSDAKALAVRFARAFADTIEG